MKKIDKYITESNNGHLWKEILHEHRDEGEIHTYDCSEGSKKFDKGFLVIDEEGYVVIEAFDDFDEYSSIFHTEDGEKEAANTFDVGQSKKVGNNTFVRVW